MNKYLYRKGFDNEVGKLLRHYYENAKIRTEDEFKEVLNDVLSSRKEF
jgi:putative GTP pyrophosphokinase